jgi:AAA+ ATPase superfamily predicted ATPase
MGFVNRENELAALDQWWKAPGGGMALVWGRRRVGKTALLQRFAEDRRALFHTATGRPLAQELAALSLEAAPILASEMPGLGTRPFASWDETFKMLGMAGESKPLLLVIDEFPEAVDITPELPSILRAVWDRLQARTHLKILLAGSAVRTMHAMQEERAPLYGRFDLRLPLHPFDPREASRMLPALKPADQALVWGLVGGVPLYLQLWDQQESIASNLSRLACRPGGQLLTEGELLLATEAELGDLGQQILYAIAAGRTKYNEIADTVDAEPARTLDRLIALQLVDRIIPVTDDPRRTRRRLYRIADNFLAFWLGLLDRYRPAIDRGLGPSILPVLLENLGDHLGPRWEDAFRKHLIYLANQGSLGQGIVAIGPFWTSGPAQVEIDAVALAGRSQTPVLVGEAKWTRHVNAERIRRELERKAESLPGRVPSLRYAICARERVDGAPDDLCITAADIFAS